ncbi:MAG: hypothetical protein GDA37_04980, partial [Ekhidna sp.]|nr:hypothetical protein [Ekhidna sp.]
MPQYSPVKMVGDDRKAVLSLRRSQENSLLLHKLQQTPVRQLDEIQAAPQGGSIYP